ncbi:mechanosensitive ion channel family protein [Pedobacter nutrimenti]|uniref:Small-conductance mechanosensitive channel n=1 Tax=Pedobacter nutrimenti TaxID=1241337 RepID=A0A318ULT7_9SPHI|nr:mechanosensitive ion channel domain-containing protein [Pedobacter nutrimenti]PYF75035.1 small-conductance mechanosensitive channel [Pedobacter nutrimenti]
MAFYPKKLRWLLLACLLFCLQNVFAQQIAKAQKQRHVATEAEIPLLVNKVENYTITIDKNNFVLKRGFDFSSIEDTLPGIEKKLKAFKLKFEQQGKKMNLRSLNSAVILLQEQSDNLNVYKKILTTYNDQLTKSNVEIKKILGDPDLNVLIPDSVLNDQLHDLLNEGRSLDTLQRQMLSKVNLLRNRLSVDLLQLHDLSSDMSYLSISKKIDMFSGEEPPLFKVKASQFQQSYAEIIVSGIQRSFKIISIFLGGKMHLVTLALLTFIFITTWLMSNMRRVRKQDNSKSVLQQVHFLRRSVLIGSLAGFFTYAPLFFANPPMSFLHLTEAFRMAAIAFLLLPFLNRSSRPVWIALLLLWLFYAIDDVLLDTAFGERWGLFIAGILLLLLCIKMLRTRLSFFRHIEESPAAKMLIIFTLAQVILSILFNLGGCLALAKIFGVSAIQCLMLGISLKVFCTMVLEAIYLQTEAYHESRFSDFINYRELQHRFLRNLWILACIVWAIGLIRNLTLYDVLMKVTDLFFHEPRSIGSYQFTFASIAIFFCIIWFSSLISSFISFFFGHEKATAGGKRSSLNSMMLLIRLAIWTVGFLIAVAAAGIPIDKLSIMLGALGVGIGFGLQNIVNNLVSGVILAFERPIQIGDQIEIGNKSGTVKEIGVRSSKIHNAEGADIIVPNGDLLSQHLINWTMQDRSKRVEFMIGVPYSTDLDQAREIIAEKLKQNENILQNPAPVIIIQDFGEYAISIRILVWVADLGVAGGARSSAMTDTKKALSDAGIQLQIRPLN